MLVIARKILANESKSLLNFASANEFEKISITDTCYKAWVSNSSQESNSTCENKWGEIAQCLSLSRSSVLHETWFWEALFLSWILWMFDLTLKLWSSSSSGIPNTRIAQRTPFPEGLIRQPTGKLSESIPLCLVFFVQHVYYYSNVERPNWVFFTKMLSLLLNRSHQ